MSEKENPKLIKDNIGEVKPREIIEEMQASYLDYAMSVIVSRALPDVRDGLKPVHRRILFAMQDMGLTSQAKFRKSATVVGEVLGKYHPHGDSAVYDTMVRMAQPFAMRYPLVNGQGNFGSMDGDNPAAMRYTEAKLKSISDHLLADIDKDTVDFTPNYDGSRKEPKVLPAKLPNLLLNGTVGIAVGMATNIPPHNITEIIDGTVHLIDNPEASSEDLMQFIKGPDFPTGGNIYGGEQIKAAYTTGKGSIVMRGDAEIEETKNGYRILISSIPYQVNKSELISKIADLVKEKRIIGVSDIRDESDRKDNVRIVIELRSNAYPKRILNRLYELTSLQNAFHVNLLALIDGIQPRVLTLKIALEEYIKHRQGVITRRTKFELRQAEERAHILEGLKIALDNIDAVIEVIKKSADRESALKNLIAKFKLSERQGNAILEMRLAVLAALERQKIDDELKAKLKLIAELKAILADTKRVLNIIKDELKEIKDKYGDERKTKIHMQSVKNFTMEDLVPNEQVIISLTRNNYIKRMPISTFAGQGRGGKGVIGMTTKDEDVVDFLVTANTHDDIMFFSDQGRVYKTKVWDIPAASRQAKGQALVNIIQASPDEKITALVTIDPKKKLDYKYFFMTTEQGTVKKTAVEAYSNIRKTGIIALRLNKDDKLLWVQNTTGTDKVMIVSQRGQGILFDEKDVRPMGRSAAGVRGMKLRISDKVIAVDIVRPDAKPQLVTVLERGYGKRTDIMKHFTPQKRGGIGIRASKISEKTGPVVAAFVTESKEGEIIISSANGQVIRIKLASAKPLGRDTQGVKLMGLNAGDKVSSVAIVAPDDQPAASQGTAMNVGEVPAVLQEVDQTPNQ